MTEPDVSSLLSVADATAVLDSASVTPRSIEVPLEEAQGLRLSSDVAADRDYPPFDRSMMDGIACRWVDLGRAGIELEVVGEIPAGKWPSREVSEGKCLRIMTGAPLPAGADTVVPVEFLEAAGQDRVRLLQTVKKGNAVAARGSEVHEGQTVLRRGMALDAAQLAAAATVGAARVQVYARPRAAVLTTGDEIVPFDTAAPGRGQIRNSNSLMLLSLLWRFGCDVTDLGTCPDRPEALREALRQGLLYDVLLVSGGMSMGEYDYVPAMLTELGVELKITKIKIKPGKPFVYGTSARKAEPAAVNPADRLPGPCHVFGLPGNPVSSFVCTTLLASRLITRLGGGSVRAQRSSRALAEPLGANGAREFYQPAILSGDLAHPLSWKGSADVFTLAAANALIVRPENQAALAVGARVEVIEL